MLKPQGLLYKVPKQEIVISEALRSYQEGEYIDVRGGKYLIKQKVDCNKAILDKPYEGEPLFAKDNTLHEGQKEVYSPNENIVEESSTDYTIQIPKGQTYHSSEARTLEDDETKDLLSKIGYLNYEGHSYGVKVDNEGYVQPDEHLEGLKGKSLSSGNLELMLITQHPKGQSDGRWIELIEIEDEGNEDEALSPLRYFFDDDISIKDDKGNEYLVKQARPEDYQLRLQRQGEKHDCYPPEGAILNVKVNTYQLQLQQEAVRLLRERPLAEQRPLLQLFRNKQDVLWEDLEDREDNQVDYLKWLVLTDKNRPGHEEQRNFVAKAITTPDYAFLAGPPGSGKTTVIIELIGQLIARGKRVLLCGSTHVAIDNVLERLEEKGLIEQLGITALRVGDKGRISENVKHFQIDEVLCNCPESLHRLVRASANLVCGTTMGILQYPDFKRDRNDPSPITPEFDYLIIDESSKTTFQEFLVPALHARRWVLVGDVMQLSPYTERELVEANIRQLSIKQECLSEPHQQAIYLLHQLESLFKRGGKRNFVWTLYCPRKQRNAC